MASISLPPQPQTASAFSHYLDTAPPSPRGHRRNMTMSTPLPNPHFVFPARDPGDLPPAPEPMNRSAAPLPAFSFNPGAGHSSQPSMPTLPVNRPGGHRRRCSEFIGNDRLVTPGTAEPAPDRDDTQVPGPANLPAPGPGFSAGAAGRKRHAHRRSAAISSVDLTAISNALDTKPAASTPGTPADAKDQQQVDKPARPISHPASSPSRPTPPASPRITINGESLQSGPPDSPASLVFVDNKPSPSESSPKELNDVPATPSENATRNSGRIGPLSNNTPQPVEVPKPRPRTADASLMLSATTDDMSRPKRPISSAGHSRFRKSLSSGVLDAALRKHHAEHNSSWGDVRHSSSDDGDSEISFDDLDGSSEGQAKKRAKAKNRQKKVRSWAGAILTRGKGKRQQSKKDPSATKSIPPPVLTRTNSDVGSGLDVDFDDDNIVVIRTPTNPCAPKSHQPEDDADDEAQPTLENSWKPRSFYEQVTPSDALSPIIDLDAALGPFNTPDMGSRNVPESGFSVASRRMYSGGRRGEFIGPEMRYHRRAESAPTLPPFDRSFLKSSRLSSTLTLENPDVFYEEEEDAFLAATSEPATDGDHSTSAAAIASSTDDSDRRSVRSKESSDTLTHQAVEEDLDSQTGLGIAKDESRPPTSTHINDAKAEDPQPSQRPDTAEQIHQNNPFSGQPKAPVEAIKHEDWHRKIPIPPSPDISPRFMPVDHRPATSPLELTPNIPQFSLGGSSVSNSSFPSPDFTISSDAPHSITTSSTTDRNFSNPSYNPSMDFPHASVEDVPSLTSSASTMTTTLNRFSANIFQRPRLSTDRSASLSAAVHRRSSQPNSSKRSSLASLSKLMVGPHTERSKLSHEEKPPSDESEKARKKGRRISRLMHFWRIKEKDRSTTNPEDRPF